VPWATHQQTQLRGSLQLLGELAQIGGDERNPDG
jgi:hypothetical protein